LQRVRALTASQIRPNKGLIAKFVQRLKLATPENSQNTKRHRNRFHFHSWNEQDAEDVPLLLKKKRRRHLLTLSGYEEMQRAWWRLIGCFYFQCSELGGAIWQVFALFPGMGVTDCPWAMGGS
jgi:hypothetical protein